MWCDMISLSSHLLLLEFLYDFRAQYTGCGALEEPYELCHYPRGKRSTGGASSLAQPRGHVYVCMRIYDCMHKKITYII